MKRIRGFTLIELLVVVAIIGILIAILIPSLAKAKETVRRSTCATQLKGQGSSLAIYAAGWNSALPNGPAFQDGSSWFHDEPVVFGDTLMGIATSSGMSATSVRRWFYCPSNTVYNSDSYWTPAAGETYRRMGYEYLNVRGSGGMPTLTPMTVLPATPAQARPDFAYRDTWLPQTGATNEEVIEDIMLSQNQPTSATDWTTVQNTSTGAYLTDVSHMVGKKPAGANVLLLDGHVEWRPYSFNHTVFVKCTVGVSGLPFFSFINP